MLRRPRLQARASPGGIALADIDGDGDLDIVDVERRRCVCCATTVAALHGSHRRGRAWIAATSTACRRVVAGDYDNDGTPDLFAASAPVHSCCCIRRRTARFEDVTARRPLPRPRDRGDAPRRSSTSITTATSTSCSRADAGPDAAAAQQRQRHVHRHHRRGAGVAAPGGAADRHRRQPTSTTAATSICSSLADARRARSSRTCATARSATWPAATSGCERQDGVARARRRATSTRTAIRISSSAARGGLACSRSATARGNSRVAGAAGRQPSATRRAVPRLRQRRPARSARRCSDRARESSANVGGDGWADVTAAARAGRADSVGGARRCNRWPLAISTATATPTSWFATSTGACVCGGTTAANETRRCACGSPAASATAAASARKWSCAPAASARRIETVVELRRRRACGHRLRARRATAADAVRVLWPSGILQAETPAATAASRAAILRHHGARSQAFVVSVPVHLERHAVRVRDRFHGRRRDGRLGRAGGLEPARSRRVRSHRGTTARSRETGGTSCASPTSWRKRCSSIGCSSWPSTIRPDVAVYPNEGLRQPPRSRSSRFRSATRDRRFARSTSTATMSWRWSPRSIAVIQTTSRCCRFVATRRRTR